MAVEEGFSCQLMDKKAKQESEISKMGKGKKKSKNAFLNDLAQVKEGDDVTPKEDTEPKLSRKQKREMKLAKKQNASVASSRKEDEDAEDFDDDEEEVEQVAAPKKNSKNPPKPAKKGGFAALDSEEDEDEEDESDTGNVASGFAALDLSDDDDDDDDEDQDDDDSKSKKKDKKKKDKDKKKKDKKKKSKSKRGDDDDEEEEDQDGDDNNDNDDDQDEDETDTKKDGEKKGRGRKGKLSNKERKRLKEEKLKAEREQAYSEAKAKPTDFAVSATTQAKDENWENATDINIPSFTISAFGKTLFYNAELKIAHGRKYGLVGPNGRGKTTLLKQLANGELAIPPRIDCLYVEQEVTADDTLAVDMVIAADTKRTELLQREKEIMEKLESEELDLSLDEQETLQNELTEIGHELKARGADSAEARALSLLSGLGFTPEMQRAPTKSFSGGWRMRVSLARALFMQPTLMLLDEPTNHLDLNAVIWLDDYLQKWKNTLLIVSHDQDFLDSVCTDIVHLDDQKLFYYRGNYSQFKEQYEITKEKKRKDYEKQEKELRAMKKKGTSNKKAKEQLQKKSKREAGGARKGGKGKQGAGEDEDNSALAERQLLSRPKEYEVKFIFPQPTELSPPIIQVDDVSFAYPGSKTLFKKLSFGIDMDSRITIVGNNGVGKSTLLKIITGELSPTKGEVKINRHLRIARYHQHFVDILPMDESPTDFLRRNYDEATYQEARNRLGKFGLEGSAHTIPMLKCSGGQKARVVFASLSFQNPHIMILDEPTNNLDLESIDALCDAINEFEGGVILVSHDARLITSTDCRLWVLENKTVEEEEGGFEEYKDQILSHLAELEEQERVRQAEKVAQAEKARQERLKAIEEKKQAKIKKMQETAKK